MTKTTFGALAGLAATLSVAFALPAFADTPDPSNSTTTTTSTTTTSSVMPMPMAEPTPDINYMALYNPRITMYDIKWAHANGLNDTDIATAYLLADKSGQTAMPVLEKMVDGESYFQLANEYNLPGTIFNETDRYKDRIRNYIMAYNSTGIHALKTETMGYSATLNNGVVTPMYSTTTTTSSTTTNVGSGDILATLRSQGDFKTLLRALRRADLESDLRGPGPFTLFAPTDAAFAKIPSDQLRSLMRDKARLRSVLEFHVIPARITAADAMAMTSPTSPATLEGDTLQVTNTDGKVWLNGAAVVVAPDIMASNGVIHGIDTVLMPASSTTGTMTPNTTTGTMNNGVNGAGNGTTSGATPAPAQ